MTFLVERLAELRRQLDHLKGLRPRIAGELAGRRGIRFHDYNGAIRALDQLEPVERFIRSVAALEANG